MRNDDQKIPKIQAEHTGQPKSARAFQLSSPMENKKWLFSIGLDNKKALALFGCPIFSIFNCK